MLGEAIREQAGEELFALVEELRGLAKEALADGDEEAPRERAAERIAGADDSTLVWLLRAFGTFFHLVNQAETREILRINRERSLAGGRPASIAAAVDALAEGGLDAEGFERLLARLEIEPTLTAHPTEARRPSVLAKEGRLAGLLGDRTRSEWHLRRWGRPTARKNHYSTRCSLSHWTEEPMFGSRLGSSVCR